MLKIDIQCSLHLQPSSQDFPSFQSLLFCFPKGLFFVVLPLYNNYLLTPTSFICSRESKYNPWQLCLKIDFLGPVGKASDILNWRPQAQISPLTWRMVASILNTFVVNMEIPLWVRMYKLEHTDMKPLGE